MIDYIKGQIVELTPTELVLDNHGIGYSILISLQTYEVFQGKAEAVAYIHHYIREDEELYFGFATKDERELFRLLISVSGIGVASARMMLSTLTSEEIRQAILAEDVNKIKSVKGIGLKSAQRLVLELKDKVGFAAGDDVEEILTLVMEGPVGDDIVSEAQAALVALGYSQAEIAPVLKKATKCKTTEEIIKLALKQLNKF